MCDFPDFFNMGDLDHAGYAGVNPLGSVTFVENHDTDQNSKGEGIVANKALAYAYILTSEGYPTVFYKDYSSDKGCYGLKPVIDPLIWVHENLAAGPTQQRWKDSGVFAFERLGAPGLLAGLNKDARNSRTITVATAFGPNVELQEFTGSGHNVRTDHTGNVTITIPANANGRGYVCYSRTRAKTPFPVQAIETTQEFAGAADLDISPATTAGFTDVCRIWAQAGKRIVGALFFDASHWTPETSIELELQDPNGKMISSGTFKAGTAQGTKLNANANQTGYYLFRIKADKTPAKNVSPGFHLRVTYTASQHLEPGQF
jgi:alpha-amylase